MRRFSLIALPLILFVLACGAGVARAQQVPPVANGGLTVTRSPEDGAPAPSSLARTLANVNLFTAGRWFAGTFAPMQPVARRTSLTARRAAVRRNPIWVP